RSLVRAAAARRIFLRSRRDRAQTVRRGRTSGRRRVAAGSAAARNRARVQASRRRRLSPVSTTIDARALEGELRDTVRGEVRFDAGSRAMYSTDASNYRQVPIGVVLPRSASDVAATQSACRRFGAPVFSRGGGTSLAGETCNVAVVMDFSKYMNAILEIDWEGR